MVARTIPTETPADRRARCILAKDRRYVYVDGGNPAYPLYRLTCAGVPCIEGEDGIVERFYRGASVSDLAVDYGATTRAIEAAIRTMRRFEGDKRS